MGKLRMKTTFLLCASMILLLVLPTIFLINYTVERSITQNIEAVKAATSAIGQNVEERLSSQLTLMNRMTQSLYGKTMLDIIRDPQYSYSRYEEIERQNLLEGYLYSLSSMSDYITGIYIISTSNNLFYSSSYAIVPNHQEIQQQLLAEYAQVPSGNWYVSPHSPWLAYRGGSERVISLCRQLKDLQGNMIAVAVIDISTAQFLQLLDGLQDVPPFDTFILGENNEVISQLRKTEYMYAVPELLAQSNGTADTPTTLNGEKAAITVMELPEAGWKIVSVVFDDTLQDTVRPLTILRDATITVFLVVSALLLLLIITRIYQPLNKLIYAMARTEKGCLDAYVEWNGTDEYGYLIRSYNQMIHEINNLIEQKYAMELKKMDAEFNDLKGRINPHFILNTMQVISSTAVLNNDFETEALIQIFCSMLRYSLYEPEPLVPLYKELAHVEHYVELRRQGLNWDVGITYAVPEQLRESTVMKMLLQPIVENCYYHAFHGKPGEHIFITAYKHESILVLSVEDNGTGIDEQRLKDINAKLERLSESDARSMHGEGGIALDNIATRLDILFGDKAKLYIESDSGKGTKVTIELPYEVRYETV